MINCVNEGKYELVIKRSTFIAFSKHIETREQAKSFVDSLKAEHRDARHVCYAYIADEKGDDFGYDDNGEPSGTAGKPIYSALESVGARKTCIAVVRYFGGIKLGAGGLTRAYRRSAADLIESVGLSKAERRAVYGICCDSDTYKRAAAALRKLSCDIEQIKYDAKVNAVVCVAIECEAEFVSALNSLGVETVKDGERYAYLH